MAADTDPGRPGSDGKGWGLGFVLAAYAGSRLFYLAAGALLARVVPVSSFQTLTSDVPFGTLSIWAHWDGEHYASLAAGGYLRPPDDVSPAFFPLYPLLMRSFAELFGGPLTLGALSLWGVLISLLALPFALYFVYRITEEEWGPRAARGAVLCLAFFPTSFFLNAAYTESLFLALSAACIWAVRVRKDLLLACLLAGFATATRNVGVFLIAPLALEWLRDADRYRWRFVYLLLAPSGLILYAAYLWRRFGDPLLFYTEQKNWERQPTGPLDALRGAWERAGEGARLLVDPQLRSGPSLVRVLDRLGLAHNASDLLFLLLAVALLLLGLRFLPLGLIAYSFLVIAPAVFFGTPQNPLMGLPRYVLAAFPLFIVLGVLLKDRRALGGWLVLSAAASLLLCALFVSWRYVA